jgi:hypothetical protein
MFFTGGKAVERGDYSRPACTQAENGLLGVLRDNSGFALLAIITSTLEMEAAFSLETSAT